MMCNSIFAFDITIQDMLIHACFFCFFLLQDDKNTSSTKETLDDLFPTEDEEQSQSKAFLTLVNMSIRLNVSIRDIYSTFSVIYCTIILIFIKMKEGQIQTTICSFFYLNDIILSMKCHVNTTFTWSFYYKLCCN